MATKLIQESTLTNIANAIRAKTGKVDTIAPPDMPSEIDSISGGTDTRLRDFIENTLTSIDDDSVITVGNYAFYHKSIQSINLPNCTAVLSNGVEYASNLTGIYLPKVTSVGFGGFRYCSGMRYAKLPLASAIGSGAFLSCSNLEILDVAGMHNAAIPSCPKIHTLILRGTGVKTYPTGLPMTAIQPADEDKGTEAQGSIYVLQSEIDNYKSATGWSDYSSNLKALEGSPFEDGTYNPEDYLIVQTSNSLASIGRLDSLDMFNDNDSLDVIGDNDSEEEM